ncbi:Tyrosine-specific transport protein 2 [Heracleum sosnowskyi]|uniref:Tyrosine-specific transport protein 2 n=1 Tax=Heracleum sosnowskyi TaxID=360622 RepID=A0AAD8MCL0_9APIA|nr:Tyrosine-specific transport protein 2 [Heracleum sosnowskyi]
MSSCELQFAYYQSDRCMSKVSSCSRIGIRPLNFHTVPFRYHSLSRNAPLNRPNVWTNFDKITRCSAQTRPAISMSSEYDNRKNQPIQEETNEKSFWGAVSLIIGTAVGPGMLGLPAATIKSGPLPSTVAIILSWIYVISSILLVAELSFAVMEEDNLAEVSFTALATKTLGSHIGSFVALVYASLSFSLLVACVSGIGSIISQMLPWLNPVIAHALFPSAAGSVICFLPFKATDISNRLLCFIMLFSITSLVAIGLSVGRSSLLGSFLHSSWSVSSILPAIPVTVLTLGFHVITPFICKIAGNTVQEARKAILFGGFVPLVMVLSWNLIVLGLTGPSQASISKDPISLLLSVNPSALTAVQGFAFSALATSYIGYAVSFPKQVIDTIELIFFGSNRQVGNSQSFKGSIENGDGKVGFVTYSQMCSRDVGRIMYSDVSLDVQPRHNLILLQSIVVPLVLGCPILVASFFRSTFSAALDFAGVYANCFLFGILPPVMAYIYKTSKNRRSFSILPGGDITLLALVCIAVVLGIWH